MAAADLTAFERILRDYFDRVDAQDAMGAAELFAPDARVSIMTGKYLEGRERFGRALARVLAQYEVTSHHLTNVRGEVSGDGAEIWSYVYAYHRMAATGRPWHLWVRMYDRFRRVDGRWLIAEHALHGVDSVPPRPDIPPEWYAGHPGRPPAEGLAPAGERGRAAIAVAAPDIAAGLGRLREAVERDGALPAATKALLAAAVAAAKGHEELLRAALARGKDAGLHAADVWGAASVLPTSRGEAVAERFAVAALELFGSPEPGERVLAADSAEATGYFTDYYGEIPARIAFLAEAAPAAFVAFYLLHRGALRAGGLEPKVRELILCAVNASDFQPDFLRTHAAAARAVGATREEIVEAVLAALPVAGLAVWSGAADVLAEIE